MPIHTKCELVEKEQLKNDIFKFSIKSEEIANTAKARTIHRNKSFK